MMNLQKGMKVEIKENRGVPTWLVGEVATIIDAQSPSCVYISVKGEQFKLYAEDLIVIENLVDALEIRANQVAKTMANALNIGIEEISINGFDECYYVSVESFSYNITAIVDMEDFTMSTEHLENSKNATDFDDKYKNQETKKTLRGVAGYTKRFNK